MILGNFIRSLSRVVKTLFWVFRGTFWEIVLKKFELHQFLRLFSKKFADYCHQFISFSAAFPILPSTCQPENYWRNFYAIITQKMIFFLSADRKCFGSFTRSSQQVLQNRFLRVQVNFLRIRFREKICSFLITFGLRAKVFQTFGRKIFYSLVKIPFYGCSVKILVRKYSYRSKTYLWIFRMGQTFFNFLM